LRGGLAGEEGKSSGIRRVPTGVREADMSGPNYKGIASPPRRNHLVVVRGEAGS
jgi:hypothetical protein